ncbi:MAG: zinc ABC transporter substrate-binding protein [Deltaproteobacteria bacterium]|nr:zinc ABC transporter substrate-binding protein [Deltaproteobacteria bacterium]
MPNRREIRFRLVLALAVLAFAMAVSGCKDVDVGVTTDKPEDAAKQKAKPFMELKRPGEDLSKPLVVCSTALVADLVTRIAGDWIRVQTLVRHRDDPHAYRPRAEDTIAVRDAQLTVAIGMRFETRMRETIDFAGRRGVMLAENPDLALMRSPNSPPDAHIWWSIPNTILSVEKVRDTLTRMWPQQEERFRANADAYVAQLRELDAETKAAAAKIPESKRVIVTVHDALKYFARDYGFRTLAPMGMQTEMTVSDEQLNAIADALAKDKIPAAFKEASVANDKNLLIERIVALAKERHGHDVRIPGMLYTDNLERPGRLGGDFLSAFKLNFKLIYDAMTGQSAPEYFSAFSEGG